jgi:hypothetical protein
VGCGVDDGWAVSEGRAASVKVTELYTSATASEDVSVEDFPQPLSSRLVNKTGRMK